MVVLVVNLMVDISYACSTRASAMEGIVMASNTGAIPAQAVSNSSSAR